MSLIAELVLRLPTTWQALSRQGWAGAQAWRRQVAWATELAFKKQQLAVGPTAGAAARAGIVEGAGG